MLLFNKPLLLTLVQAYGRELNEAYDWCFKYRHSRKEAELHQAWDLYYHVFKRINKQLPSLTVLEVQYVAPALVRAHVSELAGSCSSIVVDLVTTAPGCCDSLCQVGCIGLCKAGYSAEQAAALGIERLCHKPSLTLNAIPVLLTISAALT